MKKFAIAAILVLALAFPVVAAAKKTKLSGGVVGDPGSKVSLKVVKKKGKTKVQGFKAKNINITCGGQVFDGFGFTISGALSVNKSGSFKARLPNTENPKEKLRVSGKVKKGGKAVSGNIKTNKITVQGQACDMPKQHFELTK